MGERKRGEKGKGGYGLTMCSQHIHKHSGKMPIYSEFIAILSQKIAIFP